MIGQKDILRTHQISAAIIELIDQCKGRCYLVTPWVQLWPQLERALEKATKRGVRLTFILRHEREPKNQDVARQLQSRYGSEVVLLPGLHTKLYLGSTQAVLGSMNLYDSSQTKNFEVAYRVSAAREIAALKRTVLDEDLLAVEPALHLKGSFEADLQMEASRLLDLEQALAGGGHCVTCGDKLDLERKPEPHYVRCSVCYIKAPDVSSSRWRIKFCHLCGQPFDSVLAKPLHPHCKARMQEYVNLKQ